MEVVEYVVGKYFALMVSWMESLMKKVHSFVFHVANELEVAEFVVDGIRSRLTVYEISHAPFLNGEVANANGRGNDNQGRNIPVHPMVM